MKRVLLLVVLTILLSGCSTVKEKVGGVIDAAHNLKESIQMYWACMDGCYFMQKIHEEKYSLNITKEDHDACAELCWERYGGGK